MHPTPTRSAGFSAGVTATPFRSAEDAWFWFIACQNARNDGARTGAGRGDVARPCEAGDIFRVIDRLYRNRRLMMDHMLVLRHYGLRFMPPDRRRVKEARAWQLWREAFQVIEPVLVRKGIVQSNVVTFPAVPEGQAHCV